MLTTYIIANVRLYREGLAASLAGRDGIRVLGCGDFQTDAVNDACRIRPATVIVGYSGPGFGSTMQRLMHCLPQSRFVVVGSGDGESETLACASLGVSGIVALDASLDELVLTLTCAARGEFRCSPKATAALVRHIAADPVAGSPASADSSSLTRRESEVAALIEQGYSNKQIARMLDIQLSTVKNHVHRILDKLKVSNRSQAAAQLRREPGVITAPASVVGPP